MIVTGHYDHTGQKAPFVFHGADDNATACAAVIAIAEALRASPTPPRRSVMFLVFEAEEDFLQGAFHYVEQPDRAARAHRRGAQHGHDRARRRLGDLEYPAEDNRNGVNVIGTPLQP